MKKRKSRKRKLKKSFKLLLFLVCIIFIVFSYRVVVNEFEEKKLKDEEARINEENKIKEENYNICLNDIYSSLDETVDLVNKEEEVTTYLKKNYDSSVGYKDIKTGYSFYYNKDVVYYAASTIKMLDAIYIYEKAINNEINLDDKVTYLAKNKYGASKEMAKYKVGDEVSLRNLVKYAITVSDNTAHSMLVGYIGKTELKDYGNKLGATQTMVGSDIFGNMCVLDAMTYLNKLNEIINSNNDLGNELKSYFVDSEQNYLGLEDENIKAAEKYGEYGIFYHENGIVYANNPYFVSILTHHGQDNFEKVIRNINSKIYELHKVFYEERQKRCYHDIYEE